MTIDPDLLKKLIETFKTELQEQSQDITKNLLALEKDNLPLIDQKKLIQNIFRCAHNMKGASRSLGINNVGEIAHRLESLFTLIQSDKLQITPNIINLCLESVDKAQSSLSSFIKNQPLEFDLKDLLNRIETVGTKEIISQPKINNSIIEDEVSETIRVNVKKITDISSLMEEMQTNKIVTEGHYHEVKSLLNKMNKLTDLWRQIFIASKTSKHNEMQDLFNKIGTSCNDYNTEIHEGLNSLQKNMSESVNVRSILSNTLQEEIRMLRLLPADTLLCTLPRYVRDLSQELNKKIELTLIGGEVKVDKVVLDGLKDPILHLLRNAVDHGIEASEVRLKKGKSPIATITIEIKEIGNEILISVSDDGSGIDTTAITSVLESRKMSSKNEINSFSENELLDYIFNPGFSTKKIITTVSGRGVGLDVVKSNILNLKGQISVNTVKDKGATFFLRVPLSLSSERGLLIRCSLQNYVIPVTAVERVISTTDNKIIDISGTQAIMVDKVAIPIRTLASLLNLKEITINKSKKLNFVIMKNGVQQVAMLVDEIIGEREIVIKAFNPPFSKLFMISGGTLLDSNNVVLVLNQNEILAAALGSSAREKINVSPEEKIVNRPHILVVDDSITTRTLEKSILENHNYQVTIAVNGKDAWDLLQSQKFSLLITDVSMPIMDGFTLTEHVKTSANLKGLPVIIVTSLGSDDEKKRGIEVGADAYIVKNEFESETLLDIVSQFV